MWLLILTVVCVASAIGQSFEVASIRPSSASISARIRVFVEGGPGSSNPTRFSCRNCSVARLVMLAYDVEYSQITGLNTQKDYLYDVEATLPAETTRFQFRAMLEDLLSGRFNLLLHRETKLVRGYELAVGKNGPKIKEVSPANTEASVPAAAAFGPVALDREGFPVLPADRSGYESVNGRARMQGKDETMDEFARKLVNQLDLPVRNATGLAGRYDYSLYWASLSADNSGPSLFTALESQLGLKLSAQRVAVTVLVIDHVERPSQN
jgi:uncharacterized protein (TIGR03435 family)